MEVSKKDRLDQLFTFSSFLMDTALTKIEENVNNGIYTNQGVGQYVMDRLIDDKYTIEPEEWYIIGNQIFFLENRYDLPDAAGKTLLEVPLHLYCKNQDKGRTIFQNNWSDVTDVLNSLNDSLMTFDEFHHKFIAATNSYFEIPDDLKPHLYMIIGYFHRTKK